MCDQALQAFAPHSASHAFARAAEPASFRHYVRNRRYDFGRGTEAAWQFIAFARGDVDFPNPGSWREMEDYLRRIGSDEALVKAARSVWRSYIASRSRARRLHHLVPAVIVA